MSKTNPINSPRYGLKKAVLRRRVNDTCKDCTYPLRGIGTWRLQVENCTDSKCPLWDVRPVSAYEYSGESR